MRHGAERGTSIHPGEILAAAALFIVLLAEAGRIPVDNPATHLELTMIHEAMVLEYSGADLALVEWASAVKELLFMTLLAGLFFPIGVATSLAPQALAISALALSRPRSSLSRWRSSSSSRRTPSCASSASPS